MLKGYALDGDAVPVVAERCIGLNARVCIEESLGYDNHGDPWRERYGGDP